MEILSWTLPDALVLLTEIVTPAHAAGYDIAIVGSVATHGQSHKDLNLLVKPNALARSSANYGSSALQPLFARLGASYIGDDICVIAGEEGSIERFLLADGRVVAVHFPATDFAH